MVVHGTGTGVGIEVNGICLWVDNFPGDAFCIGGSIFPGESGFWSDLNLVFALIGSGCYAADLFDSLHTDKLIVVDALVIIGEEFLFAVIVIGFGGCRDSDFAASGDLKRVKEFFIGNFCPCTAAEINFLCVIVVD